MQIIKREMKVVEITTTDEQNLCQASINSDGHITLRTFGGYNKDHDEIVVLNQRETNAIFDLMKVLSDKLKNDLPF